MTRFAFSAAQLLVAARFALTQTIELDGRPVGEFPAAGRSYEATLVPRPTSNLAFPEANETTVAPAVEKADASPTLFQFEGLQLTDGVLANLTSYNLTDVELFAFKSDSSASVDRRAKTDSPQCKTYPGDPAWPSPRIWRLFDALLGGALIKTVPEASICYTDWGHYSASECESLTKTWNNSTLR